MFNGFVKVGEVFFFEVVSLYFECLWLMKWFLIIIIVCIYIYIIFDRNNCLEILGWIWVEELMKGSDGSGCYVYVFGFFWLYFLLY